MKIILTLLTFLIISITSFSQIDYPRFDIDSMGQKVVVMTIEQAQILNNKAQLLSLLEQLDVQINNYDSICIKVINEKEIVIAKQDIQINNLKELANNKDQQIENLQEQIANYKLKEDLLIKEIENKDKEINLHLNKIRKQRNRMILGSSIGGSVIVGLIILIVLSN